MRGQECIREERGYTHTYTTAATQKVDVGGRDTFLSLSLSLFAQLADHIHIRITHTMEETGRQTDEMPTLRISLSSSSLTSGSSQFSMRRKKERKRAMVERSS